MKTIVFLTALLLGSIQLQARNNDDRVDKYSPDGSIYYKGIVETASRGNGPSGKTAKTWIKNIQVFDLTTGESWKVFFRDFGKGFSISKLVIEHPFVESDLFYSRRENEIFKNRVHKAKSKDRILIVVRDIGREEDILWVANKRGKELQEIATVAQDQDWHIDVGNQKIRVFTKRANKYSMKEYDW